MKTLLQKTNSKLSKTLNSYLSKVAFLLLFLTSFISNAQFTTAVVNGTIGASEYGTHTDGNNQQTNSGTVTYMTWDATNLYIGVAAANTAEAFVVYFDKDNLLPIDGGTNANGTLVGNPYDGTNFAGLPFRADIVMYVKNGYREFRTADGLNGWSAATSAFGTYVETGGNVREYSIPWTSFPGGVKPAAFNWFSYVTSSGGFVYGQVPTANAGGNIGTSARYERYYSVLNTATGTSTKPMSRDCYVFNSTVDNNTFGAITVADFTMNSAGRQIARVAGNWNISGTLRVNAGSIFYGSGGSYGSSTVGNAVVSGGTLDMDANNQLQAIAGTVAVSGGTFNVGNSANNVTISSGISTVANALTISGGTINVSNGVVSIGTTGGGNQALLLSGGTLNLTNNGRINLNGNFTRPTAGGQFNQSGSTSLLAIDGNSGTAASSLTTGVNSFNVVSATGTGLNCTAGTIRIVDPHHSSIATGGPRAVSISYGTTAPTAYQFSGTHTFEFGDGTSTTGGNADGFVVDNYVGSIRVPLNNVIINSGATANRWVSSTSSSANGFYIKGNLTINTGCEFRNTLSSAQFAIEGNIGNAGTLTSSQTLTFASTPIAGGSVVASTVAQTVSGAGTFQNLIASPTAKFTNLTFNNTATPAAVQFTIGDVSTSGANTFTAGIVDIGNNNNYIFGSAATASRTAGYVLIQGTGQMRKDYAIGATNFTYHIGENTGTTEYSPYALNFTANSVARTIGVQVIDAVHPNVNDVDTQTDYISRYWKLTNSAAGTYSYNVAATYLPVDVIGTEANMKMNMWSGASPWTQVSSSVAASTITVSPDVTETTCPLGATAEFTGRVKLASNYTWNQTGTAAYGTASNWTPTRTSPASDDILTFNGTLTPAPTVTGFSTQTIGKLLFINNANVNLQSAAGATLTISGGAGTDLDIPAGSTLNLSGTQNIGIAFTGTTTSTVAGTLKTSTTGTGTLVFTNSTTTVTGTLDLSAVTNANTSTASNLLFSSGGTCIIGSTSQIIPTAGWNANSNLNITGIVGGTSITNAVQSFGNILYNCSAQTSTVNAFTSSTVNIQGNVEIRNSGSGTFRFGTAPTINIAGNLSITNTGNCDIANGAGSVNVTGNFVMSSTGTVDVAPSSSNATLRVGGTFNQTAGTITESSTSTGSAIEFNGTVSQSITTSSVLNTINYRVNNAAGITLPATLNINANSLLRISNGSITSGTVAYNATATTLVYDSSIGTQTTNSLEFPTVNGPANLTINNTNATPNVSLHASRSISGVLALSAGRLVLGANDFTLGTASTVTGTPSATRMVVTDGAGQLKKVFATGASSFTFPVGETTGTTEYSPNSLNFTANSTQRTIGVRVIDANHPNLNTGTTPVDYLSRYWSFTDDQAGTYTYTGTFTYVTGGVDVNGTEANIRVGRWNGAAWTQQTSTVSSPTLTISSALNETTGLLNGNDFTGRTTPNIIYTWTGTTSSDWATNGNWDIAGFPNAVNHQVVINTAGGNQPIIASGSTYNTGTITINNAASILTLNGTASLTTNGLATITAGTVTLNGTSTVTTAAGLSNAGTISVGTGYLNLQTSFANTGTITSACTGTIEFGIPGGTIPQNITYGNLTVSGAGSFVFSAAGAVTVCGNYSQPGATTASTIVTLANSAQVNTMTVGGNYTVSGGNATFPSNFRFINSSSAASNATVAVTGDVLVSGSGRLLLEVSAATTADAKMTVGGNFSATGIQSGSTGYVDFGTGTITGNTITIAGNFSVSGSASSYVSGSTVAGGFVFTGTGKTFSYTSSVNSQYTQYTINAGASYQMLSGLTLPTATNPTTTFTVNGTIDMGTNVITAGNTTDPRFTLGTGATFITANTAGVLGSLSGFTNATTLLLNNTGANYQFNSAVANQSTGFSGLTITTPNSILISNTGGTVTADANVTFGNTATLTVNSSSIFDANTRLFTFGTTPVGLVLNGTFRTNNTTGFSGSATTSIVSTNSPPVTFGTTSTVEYYATAAQVVSARTDYRNLIFTGASAKTINGATTALGTVLINSGATLALGGFTFSTNGTTMTNNGTINGTATNSILRFGGSIAQTYTGTGVVTSPLQEFRVSNSNASGVTLTSGVNQIVTLGLRMFGIGGVTNANKLTIGDGTNTTVVQIGQAGNTLTIGNLDAAPTFNLGAAALTMLYLQEGTPRTTGFELPTVPVAFVTIDNTNNVTLNKNLTVGTTLTLTNGKLITSSNIATIGTAGTIVAGSNWVVGNLAKQTANGSSPTFNFPIGSDTTNFTPVLLTYAGNNTSGSTGTITANTTSGDHSQISTSGIDNTKSANRNWTLINSGISGSNYNATFTFVSGDLDGGASTSNFVVRRYISPDWFSTTTGTRTSTTTQATGLSTYGDFQLGEPRTITVATNPNNVSICTGSGTTFNSTSTSIPTPSIKWQRGISGVYTDIDAVIDGGVYSGFTTSTLSVSNVTGLNGYTYQAVFSNINGSATSTAATLTVNPTSIGGSVAGGTTICEASTSGLLTLSGHTGGVVRWESSVSPFTSWTTIANTSATYTSGALTQTTQFRAVVQSGACLEATSTTTTVTVNPTTVGGSVAGGTTICEASTSGLLTLSGHTGGVVRWESSVSPFTSWTTIANTSATYTSGALTQTTQFRAVVQSGACLEANSASTTITVDPTSIGGSVTGGSTICSGSTSSLLSLSGHTGNVVRWESAIAPFSSWSTIVNTTSTYTSSALTQTTQFRAVVQSGSCPEANSASTTVTVDPTSIGGSVIGGTTICAGLTSGLLTLSGHTGNVVRWESSIAPFTSWTSISNLSPTYTSGALTQTTKFRAVVQSGVCLEANSATTTVTVDPTSVGGSVAGGTTICSGSSSGVLTLSGHTGNVVRWESSIAPFTSWSTIANTTSTYTSGALAQTTQFRAVVQSGVCSVANSATTTVSMGITTTWSAGSWDNGAPTSTSAAIISSNYTSAGAGAGSFAACSLTVNTGAVVLISDGDVITLNGAITITSGSFTLSNTANLIQTSNVANTGTISINKTTAALIRQDYVMWSSPVAGQQLQSFTPFTLATRFYTYNTSSNIYVAVSSPSTTNFAASTGYLIRVPNTHPLTPTAWSGTFTGVPNNGNQGLTGLTSGLFYATGNPYPSAIDADAFITSNSITDPLYFWRKTNNTVTSSYATYTTAGGVSNSPADPLGLTPNGYIQSGQGFIAKAASSSLNFTNALRVANSGPLLRTIENKNRIWLDLNGTDGAFGQLLIAYMPGATSGIDSAIDGRFFGDSQTALTSIVNNDEYIIQGRALPFETTDVVPLGFKSEIASTYTISINHVDGLFETNNQEVYLKDNLTNAITNLRTGSYTFATDSGVFNNRFEIIYAAPLSVNQPTFNENSIVVYHQNNQLVINSGKVMMANVAIYDISGRLLLSKNNINTTETKINVGSTKQVLLVKITSVENGIVTKKVIN